MSNTVSVNRRWNCLQPGRLLLTYKWIIMTEIDRDSQIEPAE